MGQVRPPYPQPLVAKALEGLRRGNLVYQVKVDVEHGGAARLVDDEMFVPNLLEKCLRLAHNFLSVSEGLKGLLEGDRTGSPVVMSGTGARQ